MKSGQAGRVFSRSVIAALVGSALGGCQTLEGFSFATGGGLQSPSIMAARVLGGIAVDNLKQQADSNERKLVAEGVAALKANDLSKASLMFNAALKLNVTSSETHVLNALTYHLMALAGDSSKYELAEEGYKVALRFDATNWLADYHLGLCYLDQRKFVLAQQHLARAADVESNDADVLYDLAVASYYSLDPRIAEGALKRLREVAPQRANAPEVLRAAAFAKAALNDMTGAEALLGDMRKILSAEDTKLVERRLQDWRHFHVTPPTPRRTSLSGLGGLQLAQAKPGAAKPAAPAAASKPAAPGKPEAKPEPEPEPPAAEAPADAPAPFIDDKMVVVDVVMIGTQEDARETYGINLLNGLRLQFGDPTTNAPARAYAVNNVSNANDPAAASNAQTFTLTSMVRIPAITYSLNIANAFNARNEVIAKPSLVALSGQSSDFFSGTEISAAAVSGGAGDSVTVNKEVGIKLAVRPDFLPDGKIKLQVSAQRTFLTDPSRSVVFQFRLDTTKTNVNAHVVLKYGETLVLSGLTERETTSGNDGVPGLRDVPVLNLLFAQRDFRDFRKSILILLTPRRPLYGAQSPEDRKELLDSLSEYEQAIARLENRHQDWFRPRSVMDEARERIQSSEFFREFRTGDLKVERWDKREAHSRRVRQAIEKMFL